MRQLTPSSGLRHHTWGIGKLLTQFNLVVASGATIFVDWHLRSFISLVGATGLSLSCRSTAGYFYYTKNDFWVSPFGVKARKDKFLFEELALQPDQIKSFCLYF